MCLFGFICVGKCFECGYQCQNMELLSRVDEQKVQPKRLAAVLKQPKYTFDFWANHLILPKEYPDRRIKIIRTDNFWNKNVNDDFPSNGVQK